MTNNDLKRILDQQEFLTEISIGDLKENINALISTLNRELTNLEKLEAGDLSYAPNGLGIIQNQGNFIDVECSRLYTLIDSIKFIKGLK